MIGFHGTTKHSPMEKGVRLSDILDTTPCAYEFSRWLYRGFPNYTSQMSTHARNAGETSSIGCGFTSNGDGILTCVYGQESIRAVGDLYIVHVDSEYTGKVFVAISCYHYAINSLACQRVQ